MGYLIDLNKSQCKKKIKIYALWNMSWRTMTTWSIAYKRTVNKLFKRKKTFHRICASFWLYLQVSVEAGAQAAGCYYIRVMPQILSILEWILVMLLVVRVSEWGRKLNPYWGIGGIQSMTDKILCCTHVHHSLKMQLRLPSSNRDKIICFHEPCNQFMRKSAEAFFAVDRKQKTNHRRENSFPLDIRILVVMVMLHRHTCCRAVWF